MAKERILVVDDERNIVELIKYNLEKEGYEVICAYDGIEAVNIASQHDIALFEGGNLMVSPG